jgi:hypothetical protein
MYTYGIREILGDCMLGNVGTSVVLKHKYTMLIEKDICQQVLSGELPRAVA